MSDFERKYKGEKTYPSLAEKVLITCCKKIEEHNYFDLVDYFLFHINLVIEKFTDNIWLKYHKGKLLLLANKKEEAQEFIIPVVREKQTESWAWGLLASTFSEQDHEKSIACLVKGIEVCSDENFLTNIRLQLIKTLIKKNLLSEAKHQIECLVEFKKQQSQKLPDEIKNYSNLEWFNSTTRSDFSNEIYEKFNNKVLSILFDSLPWIKATVKGRDNKSERTFLLLENRIEAPVKFKLNKILENLEEGAPVKVKIGNETGKLAIYAVELRDGDPWDLIPNEIGIIDDINYEKELSHVILSSNKDCILYHDKFEDMKNFPIGSFISCKTKSFYKDSKTKTIILTCKITEEIPSSQIYNIFEGSFIDPKTQSSQEFDEDFDNKENVSDNNLCTSFGFVESEQDFRSIYVHKTIVQANQLANGDKVRCKVVFSRNKKGISGWRAISLTKI